MRKSRATAAIGLSVVTGLALSACAGGASDGTVTLQMVESLTNPARTEVLKSLIADFEADNPKIKVELISPPTDQADQKITQMLQSGSGVDVLEVRDITVGPFSTNGWLDDMSGELEDWKGWDDLTDNATKYAKGEDGKVYYVPYGFYGLSLFYRTDLIKEAGFDGPRRAGTTSSSRPRRSRTPRRTSSATPSVAAPTRTATSSRPSKPTSPTTSTPRTRSS